jgi:hypothetical protein
VGAGSGLDGDAAGGQLDQRALLAPAVRGRVAVAEVEAAWQQDRDDLVEQRVAVGHHPRGRRGVHHPGLEVLGARGEDRVVGLGEPRDALLRAAGEHVDRVVQGLDVVEVADGSVESIGGIERWR